MFHHDEKVKENSCMILKEYQEAIQDEYSLLCQKAKVKWLKDEDRNTTYFYKTLKDRVHRGRIITIRNEKGVRFENHEVPAQIVKHFKEFLGKSSQVLNLSCRNNIFRTKLSFEEALEMVRPISDPEIKNARFEIEDSKAHGPDGYTSRFYKTAWSIVGKNKIMTKKLKRVLGKLVSENQSAFISGRQITDNILLAQELFRGYNRKQNVEKAAFKIDLQKAYDTINWDFLKDVLVMFGFHDRMAIGKLPVRYLGVPLITKQISINDCKPLVNKVKTKINDWKNKSLSYAGRLQLIASVLNSMQNIRLQCFFSLNRQVQIPNLNDKNEKIVVWVTNNGQEQKFKISNVWKKRINIDIKVDWYSMIWFAQSIPRHAFVIWLAIQKKLMTHDKMLVWRPNEDFKCVVCKKCSDSHNHLFFTFEFSKEIWNELIKKLNVRLSGCWDQIIDERKVLPAKKNIWSIVRRLVCGATMYYIWKERNNRLFKNGKRESKIVLNIAKEAIGMKLMGLKVKES
nr:hypothetical protein [Tanacetum cinerariifolium]